MHKGSIIVRWLGRQAYLPIWQRMQQFTDQRDQQTPDEIWLLEHHPVYTQGQAGKPEHLLQQTDIPVVAVDRGGQITYHGPGQLMMYVMLNLKRHKLGVRTLVSAMESTVVDYLAENRIIAYAKSDAPGVYVDELKICSVGLRIRKGCSFHGLALNVAMDLSPFEQINPCGYSGLKMVDCTSLGIDRTMRQTAEQLLRLFCQLIDAQHIELKEGFDD